MYLGPYESGNAGTARRVDDRLGRVPHGFDVVLMQVVDECRVIPSEYCVQTPGSPRTVAPFATAAAKNASTAPRPSAENATCAAVVTGSHGRS